MLRVLLVRLSTLKRRAQAATKYRGHRMRWGVVYGRANGPKSQHGQCRDCGASVSVHERPAPNDIDVGGLAVAVNCKDGR